MKKNIVYIFVRNHPSLIKSTFIYLVLRVVMYIVIVLICILVFTKWIVIFHFIYANSEQNQAINNLHLNKAASIG